MSHYSELRTTLKDELALVKALQDLGYPTVERHDSPQALFGFAGEAMPQEAEVIVRREFLGKLSNDLGFRRLQDGTFQALISDMDHGRFDAAWFGRLSQRYAYHVTISRLTEQGFDIQQDEQEGGRIRLVLRRMA